MRHSLSLLPIPTGLNLIAVSMSHAHGYDWGERCRLRSRHEKQNDLTTPEDRPWIKSSTMSLPPQLNSFFWLNFRPCLGVREDLHGLSENASTSTPCLPAGKARTSTLLQISRINPIPIVFREIILPDDFFQLFSIPALAFRIIFQMRDE